MTSRRGHGRLARHRIIISAVLAGVLTARIAAATDEPATDEDAVRQEQPDYTGDRLSVNFQDVEVRSVLQLIADFAGLNLVAGQSIDGRMTLRLVDVPWDEALDLVLTINGLDKRRTGSILLVAPMAEFAEQERMELERLKAHADLAPLTREFIRLDYADAPSLAKLFGGDNGVATLSDRGHVMVDARTNSLIVTDTATNLSELRHMIRELDAPVGQVQIEARIVNANANFSEELGIRFGGGVFTANGPPFVRIGGRRRALDDAQETGGSANGDHPDDLAVDLGVNGEGTSSVALGIADAGYRLDLELSALAAEGRAEIVARPKVITADKRAAVIESGVEIPYQQATRSGATSIAFKDAVLQLEVTPQITPNERIVMDLTVKQDTVGRIFHGVPSVNTTRITTQILVENGQTVVLGGIFQTDRHHTTVRTPLFGELPFVGRLFRRTLERDDKHELFVFITPSIIPEPTGSQARMAAGKEAG